MLTASTNIVTFIKGFESYSPSPYWDNSQWSWGHGTKAPGATGFISREQAHAEMMQHVKSVEIDIDRYVTRKGVTLNPNQFDALTSLVYNVGSGNIFTKDYSNGFPSGSRLYNLILLKNFPAAALRFNDFVKGDGKILPGLVIRRTEEAALFSTNYIKSLGFGIAAFLLVGVLALSLTNTSKK